MGDMLRQRLEELGRGLEERVRKQAEGTGQAAIVAVKRLILEGRVIVRAQPAELSIPVCSPESPELHIRSHRLKEAYRSKEALEQKLASLSESIQLLSESVQPKSARELQKRASPVDEQKRRESADFARRLMSEQRSLKARRELRTLRLAEQLSRRIDQSKSAEFASPLPSVKEERLKSLEIKTHQRQQRLLRLREELQPLSPESRGDITFPDISTAKAAPSKQHVTIEELKAHLRRYSEERKYRNERRERAAAEKRLTDDVNQKVHVRNYTEALEQTKAARAASTLKVQKRREAVDRQKRYSELVKEMYPPMPDPRKAEEVDERKARLNSDATPLHRGGADPLIQVKPPVPRFKRKAQQTLTPQPPERPKPVDYLDQQRQWQFEHSRKDLANFQLSRMGLEQKFQGLSNPSEEAHEVVKAKILRIEAKARRDEAMLAHLNTLESTEVEAEVNEMLIISIKAKLALLHS